MCLAYCFPFGRPNLPDAWWEIYSLFRLNIQVLKILEGGSAILDSNSFGSRSGYIQGPNSKNHSVSKRHSRRLSY